MELTNLIPKPYVYKIKHKESGKYYIGSRTAKNIKHYSLDLGKKYFTSAKYIHDLGFNKDRLFEDFEICFINEFDNPEETLRHEHFLIYAHLRLNDNLCLNRSHRYFAKNMFYNSGISPSLESIEKCQSKRRGKKFTDEARQNMSESHTGLKYSDSHRKAISNGLKGKKKSEAHSDNISKSLKGRKAEAYQLKGLEIGRHRERSQKERDSVSERTKNTSWINNGIIRKRINLNNHKIPEGFSLGYKLGENFGSL